MLIKKVIQLENSKLKGLGPGHVTGRIRVGLRLSHIFNYFLNGCKLVMN